MPARVALVIQTHHHQQAAEKSLPKEPPGYYIKPKSARRRPGYSSTAQPTKTK